MGCGEATFESRKEDTGRNLNVAFSLEEQFLYRNPQCLRDRKSLYIGDASISGLDPGDR